MPYNKKNLLFNSKFGDCYLSVGVNTCRPSFMSTSNSLLKEKERMLEDCGMKVSKRRKGESGYGGKKEINVINSLGDTELKDLYDSYSNEELLRTAEEKDLILLYLDDGSWHKRSELMHLYCNELTENELKALADRVEELYGTRPTLRWDKKKDGRSFPYFYFPRKLVDTVRDRWFEYVKERNMKDLYYKFGGEDYVNYSGNKATKEIADKIRKDYFDNGIPINELIHKYELRYVTIDNIIKNKTFT